MRTCIQRSVLTILVSLIPLSAGSVHAGEWYVGGQAGINLPQDISNVGSERAGGGVSISDLALETSVLYGGKLGLFFPGKAEWLGIEIEGYNSTPNIQQQSITGTSNGVVSGAHLRMTTLAFTLLARYPSKLIQPYVGAGLGIFFSRTTDQGISQSETNPGINAQVGVRYFIAENFAVFTEYKFNYAQITFTKSLPNSSRVRLEGDYISNNLIGGISFHFNGPS